MIVALSLSVVACSSSQVFASIEAALQAISALQSFLPVAGVSPALAKEVGEYASAAATGVGQCSALLAAGGETVTLVSKCGQFLAAAVQPTLPPGTSQQVIGMVSAVYAEIQVVYAAIEAASPAPPITQAPVKKAAMIHAHAVKTIPAAWNPSKRDSARMLALSKKALALAQVK